MRTRVSAMGLLALCFVALSARVGLAQTADSVSDVLPSLLTQQVTLGGTQVAELLANSPGPGGIHTAHFFQGSQQHLTEVAALMNAALATQLATYPTGYSSGGFTYTFDAATSTERRSSTSFGPAFADRPFTLGRKHWNVAFNYQHTSFDTLEGKNLDNGEIQFYFVHNDCCPPATAGASPNVPPFEEDLIQASLRMKLSSDTVTLSGTYGVTDRLDVGAVLPIVHVSLDATLDADLIRLGSVDVGGVPQHAFPDGSASERSLAQRSASATGIGDIVLRAKYVIARSSAAGLAAAVDLRLPTGSADDLLGTGATQARFMLIGATAIADRLFPHVNFGYTASQEGFAADQTAAIRSDLRVRQSREVNYTFGFDSTLTPRITAAFDVIGRTLVDGGGLEDRLTAYQCCNCGANPALSSSFAEFFPSTGNLNLVLGSAGVRYNVRGNLLIQAHALFPLRDSGLVDKFTPVVGLEYAF
jgi:hypothetical protein